MKNSQFRAYVKTCVDLGKKPIDIWRDLDSNYPGPVQTYKTVCKWAALFNEGRESVEDDPRSGRPITRTTPYYIKMVRELIEINCHISMVQIEAETSLSQGTINIILHQSLQLQKLASRWLPYLLTDLHREKRLTACRHNLAMFESGKWRICDVVTADESWIYWRQVGTKSRNMSWVGKDQPPSTIVRQGHYEPKSLITVLFKSTGTLHVDCVPKGGTINAGYYVKNCLTPLVAAIQKDRPTSGTKSMKLLHDNARPHVAKKVKTYLEQQGIATISHPPYSPDLAPCDFWLFSTIKRQLGDHSSEESLKTAITKILKNISVNEYRKTFEKWLERMQLCIDRDGDYFEHLIKKK